MKYFKRAKRLSLWLGPIVALVMILNVSGAFTMSGLATYSSGSSSCPTNASVVTGGSIRITRNGSSFNASSLDSVRQGDIVKVTFDLDDRCTSTNVPISVVSYKAPSATSSNSSTQIGQRVLFDSASGTFNKYGGSLTVDVSSCYFSMGLVYGNVITNMSSTNTYGSRQVAWEDGGTQSCGSSSTTTTTSTSTCPSNSSAVTGYYFTYPAGSTTKKYDLSGVKQGDDVYAYFTLKSGCTSVPLAFAAYTAKEPYYNVNTVSQQVYMAATNDDGTFNAPSGVVHTKVPNCYFQIDFVYGNIITQLSPTNLYNDRKIEWLNGGTNACGPTGQEQPTATPTKTPTKTAVPSNTPTNTSVPSKTATPITPAPSATPKTPTVPAPSVTPITPAPSVTPITPAPSVTPITPAPSATPITPVPSATPVPPGTIFIHIRDSKNAALGGATVDVSPFGGPTITVTDNTGIDQDPAVGEIKLTNLAPGAYSGTQTAAKAGYNVDPTMKGGNLPAGGTIEWTFINTQPGNLNVLLKTNTGAALPGGCFAISGPGTYSVAVCDGQAGDTDGASNGTVVLTGLVSGDYSGTQSFAPNGWVKDNSTKGAFVPEGDTGVITFINNPVPGGLVVNLVDGTNGNAPLNGGCFTVTGIGGFSNNFCITDNGTARIGDLTPGNYNVVQTSAPEGYQLGTVTQQTANVPSGNDAVVTFTNTQLGGLIITLSDIESGAALSGCFNVPGVGEICDNEAGDTDPNVGVIQLINLVPGTYSATQTVAPDGYTFDPELTKSDEVPAGGFGQIDFVNTPPAPPQNGTLVINKFDDENNRLGGACFGVAGLSGEATGFEAAVCDLDDPDAGDGSANGEIVMNDMAPGEYQVFEMEAPDGYQLDEQAQVVAVVAGERTDVGFINVPNSTGGEGRYIKVYKLNCENDHNRLSLNWDNMPADMPSDCQLAPGVNFTVYDEQGNPVGAFQTGAVGTENEGWSLVFIEQAWGVVTIEENSNPTPVVDDNVRFQYDVDFGCECQYPTTGAVNVLDN